MRDVIHFLDFPGERGADITMFNKSYDEWSDSMLKNMLETPCKTAVAEPFLSTIKSTAPQPVAVIAAWKLCLARLFLSCHTIITPSTFVVDNEGKTPVDRVNESGTKPSGDRGICTVYTNQQR